MNAKREKRIRRQLKERGIEKRTTATMFETIDVGVLFPKLVHRLVNSFRRARRELGRN